MFLLNFIFILASDSPQWWNYPGFEAWKFFNLAIFVAILVYIMKRANIGAAFRARGETIKAELEKARSERDAALAKLKEVEERLAGLNDQVSAIKDRSKTEAQAERERIARSTQDEIAKLTTQAQREIENAAKVAKSDLRKFAAEQSVRMAEDMIKRDITSDDDARLIVRNIEEMGAAR
jgi:F-type H+-transporting ATPase subunit b